MSAREISSIETMSTSQEEVFDSPSGWVASHIRRYVETDGEDGHQWRGVHTLLLTTRGRKTGKLRRTALIYGRDGERYLVVASQGGADWNPNWYLNLADKNANPEVRVKAQDHEFWADAQVLEGADYDEVWDALVQDRAYYANYQSRTERKLPLVRLVEVRPVSPGQ